jgi:hypothetical protein
VESKIDLEDLASQVTAIGLRGLKEEKLKIEIEKLLGNFFASMGVKADPSYEYRFLSGERADALYGHVIIEYEPSGALKNLAKREMAVDQAKSYMKQAAKSHENIHKFFGVVLDSRQIIFVRFVSSRNSWEVWDD